MNDQILFWDTDTNATVSLSKSKKELRQKIIASTLIGGHLVIRPAELFEGEDFYFNDATQENGFLFNLMKNGAASLALDRDSSLSERAQWRFRDGTVFDRGRRYTNINDIERIKERTLNRAEKIEAVGWKNCSTQNSRPKDIFEKDLNLRIRYLLSKVSGNYFENGIEENKSINAFINGSVQVASRSDVYDAVKTVWIEDVEDSKKANFVSDCTSALTLAAIANTANNYGDRISEVKGQNYNSLSAYSSFNGISAAKVETIIIKSFFRVLPSKMDRIDSEKKHFAGMALNLEASQFAEAATGIITSRDREELNLLLYGESEHLEALSLAEYIYSEWRKLKPKDIERLVEIRIDELSKIYGKNTGRSGILISMMRSCAIEAILLKIGAPVLVPTLINTLKDLRDNESPIRPIFSGFKTKI